MEAWTPIIVQGLITITTLGAAWLALRGKLAELGRTTKAAKATAENAEKAASRASGAAVAAAKASSKTEQSINNRDSPASDRWDAIHDDVRKIAAAQITQGELLAEQGKDIRGLQDTTQQTRKTLGHLRAEDRIGRTDTEQLRQDFTEHVEKTAPMMPMLRRLDQKWGGGSLPD